jgi:hypothetical protein
MNSMDALKRKVDELQKQAEEIEALAVKLLEEAPFEATQHWSTFGLLDYNSPLRPIQREVILKYQQWFSTSLQLVNEYIPEMVTKFNSCYAGPDNEHHRVLDYLRLGTSDYILTRGEVIAWFLRYFETQLSILLSIPPVAKVKEMDLRELITADVARTEIEQAEILLDGGFERAAGSVAGVALELHLKTLCDVNGVSYPPKPTIETLVQALYKDKKIDITELKQIQYLGSIRNKCSHPEPVSAKEVQSLIDGVKKLV